MKYQKPNLENTTEHLTMYFLMLLPREHTYVLFAPTSMDDFNDLFEKVKKCKHMKGVDFSDHTVFSITRTQFLAAIDKDRKQNTMLADSKSGGLAVNRIISREKIAA